MVHCSFLMRICISEEQCCQLRVDHAGARPISDALGFVEEFLFIRTTTVTNQHHCLGLEQI